MKAKMRTEEYLPLRAMGISNACYGKPREILSVQFYDYDLNGRAEIPARDLERILDIFPYDCLLYETKHGVHFISFALLHGLKLTKARALETTKDLGQNQDYWTQAKDLTLRVSEKWEVTMKWGQFNYFENIRKSISKKPKFLCLISKPNKYRISKKHLEFYVKFMNLPEEIYNLYHDCIQLDYKIKIYHYKTRD